MMENRGIEVSKLRPWDDNPRSNDHAVETVMKRIQTFGFDVPVLDDQNCVIIAGHTRRKTRSLVIEGVHPVREMLDLEKLDGLASSILAAHNR